MAAALVSAPQLGQNGHLHSVMDMTSPQLTRATAATAVGPVATPPARVHIGDIELVFPWLPNFAHGLPASSAGAAVTVVAHTRPTKRMRGT